MTKEHKTLLMNFAIAVFVTACIIAGLARFQTTNLSPSDATASLSPAEETEPQPNEPAGDYFHTLVEGRLLRGESLSASLARDNLPAEVRRQIVDYLADCLDFRRLRPNDTYRVYLDEEGKLLRCEYESGPLDSYSVIRENDDTFKAQKEAVDLNVKTCMVDGEISSSLFDAFSRSNLQPSLLYAFADIFASRIDFNTETRKGDTFRLVFEEYYKDDSFIGYGKILFARYQQVDSHSFEGYYYATDDQERGAYYDAAGNELGAFFIKSPVPVGRLTSSFTNNRRHPILGVVRPHLGVDLAAPVGTPIMAAADGKVVSMGFEGGFGRQIVLSHQGGYKTYYGHLSRFGKDLKKGGMVSQKDIIGYVGSSGLSTGPHLDYRVEHRGHFKDPLSLKMDARSVLAGADLERFRENITELSSMIASASAPQTLYVRRMVVQSDEKIRLL
ncbi:MAG: M23 family metallopeptidase [Thermodesulfobacteriota bacterium]